MYPLLRKWTGKGRQVIVLFTGLREGVPLLNAPKDEIGIPQGGWVEHTDYEWKPCVLRSEDYDGKDPNG